MAATCAKIVIVIVNIFFTIIGVAFLVGGIFIKVGEKYYQPQLDKFEDNIPDIASSGGFQDVNDDSGKESSLDIGGILDSLAIILIVFGLFMAITGVLGMCGACCTNKCMLIVYIIIVGVIFLAQLIILIVLATNTFEERMKSEMKDIIKNKYGGIDDFSVESLSLNYIMFDYECCGVDDYKDFNSAKKWNNNRTLEVNGFNVTVELVTPLACCKTEGNFPNIDIKNLTCTFEPTDDSSNWKQGCWKEIESSVLDNKAIFLGIFAAILVFELLCIILAICIVHKAKQDEKNQYA